ncbi:MAG: 3'-5' exonuclease [Polaromonas sp.]|nr:3'-5' exonuclease [Polaromonas sp.]
MDETTTPVATSAQLGFGFDDGAAAPAAAPSARPRKPKQPLAAAAPLPAAAQPAPPVTAPLPDMPALDPSAEAMARQLESHPDYRILRRLPVTTRFAHQPSGPVTRVLVLDTETTGLEHSRDRIMELAMLLVDVETATGLPTGEVEVYDGLEDPGIRISREVEQLTGINDDMVRGQKLDEPRVLAMLARADLVLAHNAGFDRPFAEARLPQFASLPWACSVADLEWKKEGRSSSRLTQLALELGWFYDAHRAEMDCHALLAVLAAPLPVSGRNGLAHLLGAAGRPGYRLQATAAPFDAKDVLKARGYRWDGANRVWHTRLSDDEKLQAECDWLKAEVYGGRSAQVQVESFDAFTRYSSRPGQRTARTL